MNNTEWNQSPDSLRNDDLFETDANEVVLNRPLPILDQLAKQVDISTDLKDAEAVISKIAEVAENNHTIEHILERKHEVKDFAASKTQLAQNTSRLSELLAQQYHQSHAIPPTSEPHGQHQRPGMRAFLHSNTLYAQAIKYGFASAALALITSVVLVIALK